MTKLLLYIKTVFKLGISNVLYVLWYRFTLKSGIRKRWFPIKNLESSSDYFTPSPQRTDYPQEWRQALIQSADKILSGQLRYYAYHWKQVGNPPNWFLNPFNNKQFQNTHLHWTELPDFDKEVGDIKNIWEASRFEWVTTLARAYAITGEAKYLNTINAWLRDWSKNNPLNAGPNWKCGQEASIRVFNLLNAAKILQQETQPTEALIKLVTVHLKRIASNIRYAMAQDNNHGTSEAAGLFIAGSWLANANANANAKAKANAIAKKGRYWLENRVKKLIAADGSFSQHSVNYHRVMLDTLSFTEIWRIQTNQKAFSNHYYEKARAASNWLNELTDAESGNAPNLGANDGALLNNLHNCGYRDFSPSNQLAGRLFFNLFRLNPGVYDEPVFWFNLMQGENIKGLLENKSVIFSNGYVKLAANNSWALLRFPYFKFRPSHNDIFHFDLWYNGQNILCDSGSYSYNPPVEETTIDLKSVHHHNTVSFDNQEQMPKISRFLLGNWLQPEFIGSIKPDIDGTTSWKGSYIDNNKNRHQRKIVVKNNNWIVEDALSGNFSTAIIGFNLNTLDCELKGNQLILSFGTLTLPENEACNISKTVSSEFYFGKRIISRLNIKIAKAGTYKTYIHLK